MSFVVTVPDLVQGAAQDLAGIRASLADAAASAAAPTTGVLPAAGDEISAAIARMFGNFGQEFQTLNAQGQAFHTEFVNLINAGAGAYLSTEVANAEQSLANALAASVPSILGGGASAAGGGAVSAASGGLFGGFLGGGTAGGPLITSLTGGSDVGSVLSGLGASSGILGGLTGGTGLLGGLGSVLSGALPGLPNVLGGLGNSLTGVVNSLLPGLVQLQLGAGPYFTGLFGPYEALFYNTLNNLQSLGAGWLADPFPFLRQFIANQIGYGQIIATALQTGNFGPVAAIPADIAHNFGNVVATLTDTSVTSSLVVESLLPNPVVTVETAVGLPLVFGASLLGPPVATLEAAGSSASAFTSAVQAGDAAGAFAALFDAPAVIANGFLNGQATFPYALSLSGLTNNTLSNIANVSVVGNLPLDGILHPPGYYPVTATVTLLGNDVLPPINVDLGVGSTPFAGLLPFLINYAPQQLAHAIGAPASPPPLLSVPLWTF